jgi:type VII ESX secretion system EccE translocon-like protein
MSARVYRFAPLDHRAWLLGLSGVQCVVLGAGLTMSACLLRFPVLPLPVAALPVLMALGIAFVPIGGQRAHELAVTGISYLRAKPSQPWLAPIPLFVGPRDQLRIGPPPTFDGVAIGELPRPEWAGSGLRGVAVVESGDDATVVVRARASGFALASGADQDRLVGGWGDVLAAFCAETSVVTRLVATEHATAADLSHARDWIDRNGQAAAQKVRDEYGAFLDEVSETASTHDVLVTLTVDRRRTKAAVEEAVLAETRRLVERLDSAGIRATVLSPQEVTTAVAARLDPTCASRTVHSLADAPGLAPVTPWPLAQKVTWDHVRTDGAVHRTWWVAEWPRLDVSASWLDALLSARAAARTVVLYFEPVPPSASRRRIDRDATRLATDAEQRANRGFRVGARHHRSRAAVDEREAELVAGYAEVGIVGIVVATATTDDGLVAASTTLTQAASAAGLEVRQLDGRHDLALATALPLGRPVREPRL